MSRTVEYRHNIFKPFFLREYINSILINLLVNDILYKTIHVFTDTKCMLKSQDVICFRL